VSGFSRTVYSAPSQTGEQAWLVIGGNPRHTKVIAMAC